MELITNHTAGQWAYSQKLDHKLKCIMEQATKPVERQYDGQETCFPQKA